MTLPSRDLTPVQVAYALNEADYGLDKFFDHMNDTLYTDVEIDLEMYSVFELAAAEHLSQLLTDRIREIKAGTDSEVMKHVWSSESHPVPE